MLRATRVLRGGGGPSLSRLPTQTAKEIGSEATIPCNFTNPWQRYLHSDHSRGMKFSATFFCYGMKPVDFARLWLEQRRYTQMLVFAEKVRPENGEPVNALDTERLEKQLQDKKEVGFKCGIEVGAIETHSEGYEAAVLVRNPSPESSSVSLSLSNPDLWGSVDNMEWNFTCEQIKNGSLGEVLGPRESLKISKDQFPHLSNYSFVNAPEGEEAAFWQKRLEELPICSKLTVEGRIELHKQIRYLPPTHARNVLRTWNELTLEGIMDEARSITDTRLIQPEVSDTEGVGMPTTSPWHLCDYTEEVDEVDASTLAPHETWTMNYKAPSWNLKF